MNPLTNRLEYSFRRAVLNIAAAAFWTVVLFLALLEVTDVQGYAPSLTYLFMSHSQTTQPDWAVPIWIGCVFFAHGLAMLTVPRWSLFVKSLGYVAFPAMIAAIGSSLDPYHAYIFRDLSIGPMIITTLAMGAIIGNFSQPLNAVSLGWLFMLYFVGLLVIQSLAAGWYFLVIAYVAACWIPGHRRMGELWRPTPLPRLRARARPASRGMTLIELLIAFALINIWVVGIMNVSSYLHRAAERAQNERAAAQLAEDQIALLRAAPAPGALDPGRHALDASLAPDHPLAARAHYDVRPGPAPALREVRVTITLAGAEAAHDVSLAVLIAAPPSAPPRAEASRP